MYIDVLEAHASVCVIIYDVIVMFPFVNCYVFIALNM